MAYNEDGNYVYETPLLASGPALDVAAAQLAHDVEEYLFDGRKLGYNKPEFLSWALARFHATKQSSGNLVNQYIFWDPTSAGEKAQLNPREHNTWVAGSEVDLGIRYPEAAFQADHVDTSQKVGPADAYAADEIPDPVYASRVTAREPKVVGHRDLVTDLPQADDTEEDDA